MSRIFPVPISNKRADATLVISVFANVMIRSVYTTNQVLPKSNLQSVGRILCNSAIYIVRLVAAALMIIVSYGFLIVSFYSVAHADTCDEFGVLTTTTPAPPHDEWLWRVYAQELAAVMAARIDLVLVGDLLAQAWDMKMWAPKKVLNLGIGGYRTQHVLWRLQNRGCSRSRQRRSWSQLARII